MKGCEHPFVTVIVPTYNRRALLRECLASLLSQTYAEDCYEIIIVDDGSTDGTDDLVDCMAHGSSPELRYFRQSNRGPAAARNLGMKTARGEIIAFTDDDCIASPTWLENGTRPFGAGDIAAVQGQTLPTEPMRVRFFPPRFAYVVQVTEETWPYPTCNMFYRTQAILDVGGFNEQYRAAAEDADLAWRIKDRGMKIVFSDDVLVHHAVSYYTLAARLAFVKRSQFEPLLFREHPHLRKHLLFGFVHGKEILHVPFFILAIIAGVLSLLRGAGLVATAILAVIWFALYLWSNVFVDSNLRDFPLRIALCPAKLLLHIPKFFYRLLGSIRYRSLVI